MLHEAKSKSQTVRCSGTTGEKATEDKSEY